jgi:ABC-type spermidine/putrescine transport system permease subunit II
MAELMERHHPVSKTKTLLNAPVVFMSVFFVTPVTNSILRYFRFSEFSNVLGNHSLRGVAWFSLWEAIISTLVTLAIGLPATWALSRFTFRGARLARGVLTAPFVLPAVVVAAGVLAITDSRGVISILWAHVVFNVSVVLRIVGPRWAMVNLRLEHAAATLGARHHAHSHRWYGRKSLMLSLVQRLLYSFIASHLSESLQFLVACLDELLRQRFLPRQCG